MSASYLLGKGSQVGNSVVPGQMVAYGTTTLVAGVSPNVIPGGAGSSSWDAGSPLVIVPTGPLLGTLTIAKTIQASGSYFVITSSNAADVTPISWWLYQSLPVGLV